MLWVIREGRDEVVDRDVFLLGKSRGCGGFGNEEGRT